MPKKNVEKLEVKEIKTYQTSDGKIYDTEEAALEHERLLKNPEEWYKVKILELESEIAGLHITIERLEGKILALEANKFFPPKPNPEWHPFQQPFNPTAPTPKLPSEPGNVVYDGRISDQDVKDIAEGKHIIYCSDKKCVIPNASTPADATPLEACTHDVKNPFFSEQTDKDFVEWYMKNKK